MKYTYIRLVLAVLLFLGGWQIVSAETNELMVRCVAFYNLENVFDTIHDEGKNDYEYLPDGGMKWTSLKYTNKIQNMAYAIAQLGTDEDPRGAAIVGVSEVENIGCLHDLCKELKEKHNRNYVPILLEGPDRRGIDVGLLYNPDMFKPVGKPKGYELKAHYADGGVVRSRLQLWVSGYMLDDSRKIVMDKIHISVNHWPSRSGGEESRRAVTNGMDHSGYGTAGPARRCGGFHPTDRGNVSGRRHDPQPDGLGLRRGGPRYPKLGQAGVPVQPGE